jgi:asparagine synthase (glutamine-hydrolysing)
MRERIARTSRSAVLLSGGLDSSLLAWLAADECDNRRNLFAVTSAAPTGSGLEDETAFARQVADHIGVGCVPAFAADRANFYRPTDAILSGSSGPILSNRHCLTEALQIASKAGGATQMINGTFGEMTATARLPVTSLAKRLRAAAVQIYHGMRGIDDGQPDAYPFHVRLSPHRLSNLPEPIRLALRQSQSPVHLLPKRTGLLGYIPGAEKALLQPNEFYPGALRMEFPFRDLRLYRLFAGFPVEMLLKGGHDRPVVRAILDGHIPDAIRLRRQGMPAEPDRYQRMQRQAGAALARIAEFRKFDIDEWIDLDWLDSALLRVEKHGAKNNRDSNEVQLTAIAAEFLFWWRNHFGENQCR